MANFAALSINDVQSAGFKPLQKASTFNGRSFDNRKSFDSRFEESKIQQQNTWDSNPWKAVVKTASFSAEIAPADEPINEAVAIVDPFSTGALLAQEVIKSGRRCIRVFSVFNSPLAGYVSESIGALSYDATVQHDDRLLSDIDAATEDTVAQLKKLPWPIVAVLPGAETGVELAEMLANRMGVLNNGEEFTDARRNKFIMGEAVRAGGVRAVRQCKATAWADIEAFLTEWNPNPFIAVVKPIQSAGSDDVFKCISREEVKTAFDKINGSINATGLINEGVLVQEFLSGTEYVVDSVSRNGVHKVTALWQYDKRSVNGANFVYFGMRLLETSSELAQQLIAYSDSVLDALGIINGPGHMEVIMCPDGPCLVEVGCRCHGGEASWSGMATKAVGYTQVTASLEAYVDPAAFNAHPPSPLTLKTHCFEVFLVSRQSGMLRAIPGKAKIEKLASFLSMSWHVTPGGFAPKTTDCFTRPGAVQLCHEDPAVLQKDIDSIRYMEENGMLFDFELMCAEPTEKGAVVVVDPFSTGSQLAAGVLARDFKLIVVWSDSNTVAAVGEMQHTIKDEGHGETKANAAQDGPVATVIHNVNLPQLEALELTVTELRALNCNIVAVIPGAETGVILADLLADKMETRKNPLKLSEARRNKFIMGETVRAAGIRAVRQCKATTWADIEAFLTEWNPNPFIAVVKPIQSAGSDDVFKCISREEVKTAFDKINGAINGLGVVNEGVLVQEYLQGTEYVVDSVSRDGVHKTVALWEYDKRSANDANFVYFGTYLRPTNSELAQQLIAYSDSVLDALGIINGPGHMEVKMCPDGPCLVEVGSRCHGGEGTWLPVTEQCLGTGYNQVDATLDCYVRPAAFDALPSHYGDLKKFGAEVDMVSFQEGIIKSVPGVDVIRKLKSFVHMELAVQPGFKQLRTTDCFTRPGSAILINEVESALAEDVQAIRDLEKKGLFEFE